ncbi:family 2A encapsulin nanocompartment cargo protein cysteine desulfurase [Aquabacterium sp.]|uniref:family 2A encapsulin nanocompartment cargo protein cysteine desulfurase n=1 Tax=Aquabacterium sp. TaxID=1872578 RepID=UPI0025C4A7BC|nr:family 2A encapsulin nanocompartment cargo protein cysteine desulfurase [Aquabacterium sp.]
MSTSDLNGLGLPDVATLAQLANQFFSALPGQAPAQNKEPAGLPPGLSHLSSPSAAHPFAVQNVPASTAVTPHNHPASDGGFSPSLVPAASPAGTASASSLFGQSLPGIASGVPGAPAYEGLPPVPAVAAPGQVPPSFGGDLPLSTNPVSNTSGVQPILTLNPLDWGLPSDTELRDLLALRSPNRTHETGHALASGTPSYYFLGQGLERGQSGIQVPGQQHHALSPQAQGFKPPFDVNLVRRDFPVLRERVNGKPLVWLDNAATTHKPQSVIDRIAYFYAHENSNIHRAAHELAARATDAYEGAREKCRGFLNARSVNEIIYVRGTTEAINLVAKTWGKANIKSGDEIIVSHLEHHANIVPWQQLCAETGAKLRVIPVDDDGQVLLDEYAKLLNPRTRLVSFTQVSNALGTVTPARQMVAMAHSAGAKVLVDGAQSVSHMRADVIALDCDWFVFSGHKVFGPTGIGVLYGKEEILNATPPWQGGGNMIKDVTFEHTEYHDAPTRFEAGTGNIADAVGLGAAIDYVNRFGIDNIGAYEHQLLVYATRLLKDVPGLKLIGTAPDKAAVLSFTLAGYKTEEVGAALNKEGVAVRSGHHCAQPILRRFGLEATVRPSLAFYNNCADIDTLVATLHRLAGGRGRV